MIAVCNEERNTVAGTCLFGSSCKLKACFCFVNCSKCLCLCCLNLLFSLREFAAETVQISEGLQNLDVSGGGWKGPGLYFTGGGKGSC